MALNGHQESEVSGFFTVFDSIPWIIHHGHLISNEGTEHLSLVCNPRLQPRHDIYNNSTLG